MKPLLFGILSFLATAVPAATGDLEPRLKDFAYPFPEHVYRFRSQQQELEMVYMDVKPHGEAVGTLVLLHGKNFSGAYWEETAHALAERGYRVIMPDQIGFGKSSKPDRYQFTFQQLAWNTHELLKSLGVERAHVLGHSMGGMLAVRYALMYPSEVASLLLEDPLGLEDWKAKGVPYQPVDRAFQRELEQTPEKIRAYQQENYFGGKWEPRFDRWVDMLAAFLKDPTYSRMAWDQALTSEMIYTQPVCYEFGELAMPLLLIIGQRDRTAPGRELAPPERRAALGDYPRLGRQASAAIKGSHLVELQDVGHAPHIEAFEKFIAPVVSHLSAVDGKPGSPATK